jgi:two-component system, OmpR family, phosphate regulon response regulator PhoB
MKDLRFDGAVAVVADDEEDILELVEITLEDLGLRVVKATDGGQALELACSQAPDIVILDVTMPVLTGLEVARRLREYPGTASTPIMLLTARVHQSDVAEGMSTGADVYVTKPFSPDALVREVADLLAGRTRRAA